MRLGAHISAAGGLFKTFQRGKDIGCDSIMVFTKSNRQWKAKPITDEEIADYKREEAVHNDIFPVAVHASYLINIASPQPELWEKSYQALKIEVERAAAFNMPLINFHPGSYVKSSKEEGLNAIVRGVKRLLQETAVSAPNVTICLETMAGQGTNLGSTFEQLTYIIKQVENDGELDSNGRLGVCLDTCHIFAAGYDIRSPLAYQTTMSEFDRIVGLDRIKFFHFNDSKFELGQRKDRHAHIGEGHIGLEGFANFLNDPRWANYPAHLETPKTEEDEDGNEIEMDVVNLAALRSLISEIED